MIIGPFGIESLPELLLCTKVPIIDQSSFVCVSMDLHCGINISVSSSPILSPFMNSLHDCRKQCTHTIIDQGLKEANSIFLVQIQAKFLLYLKRYKLASWSQLKGKTFETTFSGSILRSCIGLLASTIKLKRLIIKFADFLSVLNAI